MGQQKILENCYRQMYRGMVEKDRTTLSAVLDESFVLIHMTGMRQSKEVFINAIENGTLNYYSAEHQHIDTTINGDTAELVGQSVVRAAVFGGGEHTWRLQLHCKLIQTDGSWKITEARASTY